MRLLGKAIYLGICMVPFAAGLIYALLYSLGLIGLLNEGFTIEHWSALLTNSEFWTSLLFSFVIAVLVIGLSISAAYFYVLSRFGDSLKTSIFTYFPLGVPAIVVAFICFDWLSGSGMVARVFFNFGWISSPSEFPVLIQDGFGIGILLAHLFLAIPFFSIVFADTARRKQLNRLFEQARSLGAGKPFSIFKVGVPILWQSNWQLFIAYGIFVSGSYEIPLLLGRQSPRMFSLFAVDKLQRFNLADKPMAYAAIFCYALILIGSFFILMKKRRLT